MVFGLESCGAVVAAVYDGATREGRTELVQDTPAVDTGVEHARAEPAADGGPGYPAGDLLVVQVVSPAAV